jgi:exopolysaccharide production protein ExoQ
VSAEIAVSNSTSLDQEATHGLAFALGFFFSFRSVIVLFSVRLLGLEPSSGTALGLTCDLLLFGMVCFSSIGSQRASVRQILRLPAVRWVCCYLAFSCLSLTWSETASPSNSVAYWLGMVIDVGNVVLLMRDESRQETASAMMKGFIWSSCLLSMMAWLMPTQADLRLGDEQFFNTNEIGNLCAIALYFAQYLRRRDHEDLKFAKILLVITLVRSLSKSTLIAFLVSESFLLIIDRSMRRRTKVLLLTSALFLIGLFWGLFEAYYDVYTNAGNQADTLTGRTAIWLYVFGATFDHPWTIWIGHGFDSWWKVVPPFGNELFEARHAENEILQQFYAYGAAGLVLLAGVYGSLLRQFRKLPSSPTRILLLSIMIFIVVRGMAVADGFDLLLPLWSGVLLSVIAANDRDWNGRLDQPAIVTSL